MRYRSCPSFFWSCDLATALSFRSFTRFCSTYGNSIKHTYKKLERIWKNTDEMSIFQQRKKAFLSNTVTEKNKRKMYFYFCKNKNYKKKYQVKLSHNFLYVHEWKTARTFHVKQYFSLLLPNVLKVKQTCYRPYIQILLHFVAVLRCSLHLFFQKKKKSISFLSICLPHEALWYGEPVDLVLAHQDDAPSAVL